MVLSYQPYSHNHLQHLFFTSFNCTVRTFLIMEGAGCLFSIPLCWSKVHSEKNPDHFAEEEEGTYFSTQECAGREYRLWNHYLRSRHATDRATAPGKDSIYAPIFMKQWIKVYFSLQRMLTMQCSHSNFKLFFFIPPMYKICEYEV